MPEPRRREATLRADLDALHTELHDAETCLTLTETLEGCRACLSANAEKVTVEQCQEIVRLVVHEVLLGDDDITVRHSIPVPTNGQPGGSGCIRNVRRSAGRSRTCSASERSCIGCQRHRSATSATCSPSATGR
jgi:hypothetical protein